MSAAMDTLMIKQPTLEIAPRLSTKDCPGIMVQLGASPYQWLDSRDRKIYVCLQSSLGLKLKLGGGFW